MYAPPGRASTTRFRCTSVLSESPLPGRTGEELNHRIEKLNHYIVVSASASEAATLVLMAAPVRRGTHPGAGTATTRNPSPKRASAFTRAVSATPIRTRPATACTVSTLARPPRAARSAPASGRLLPIVTDAGGGDIAGGRERWASRISPAS